MASKEAISQILHCTSPHCGVAAAGPPGEGWRVSATASSGEVSQEEQGATHLGRAVSADARGLDLPSLVVVLLLLSIFIDLCFLCVCLCLLLLLSLQDDQIPYTVGCQPGVVVIHNLSISSCCL